MSECEIAIRNISLDVFKFMKGHFFRRTRSSLCALPSSENLYLPLNKGICNEEKEKKRRVIRSSIPYFSRIEEANVSRCMRYVPVLFLKRPYFLNPEDSPIVTWYLIGLFCLSSWDAMGRTGSLETHRGNHIGNSWHLNLTKHCVNFHVFIRQNSQFLLLLLPSRLSFTCWR